MLPKVDRIFFLVLPYALILAVLAPLLFLMPAFVMLISVVSLGALPYVIIGAGIIIPLLVIKFSGVYTDDESKNVSHACMVWETVIAIVINLLLLSIEMALACPTLLEASPKT